METFFKEHREIFSCLRTDDIGLLYDVNWAKELGHGGGGTVYECTEKKTGKIYALKLMKATPTTAREIYVWFEVYKKTRETVVEIYHAFYNETNFSNGEHHPRFLV